MHMRGVVSALAFSLPALAAPAAKGASRSTLQVLNYNNLGPENNGTVAVLVRDGVSHSTAQEQCAAIGEKLYPLASAPQANRTEMQYQLDYLVFNNDLPCDVSLWVAQGSSDECMAYSYESQQIVQMPCDSHLPALCSSSVPPTTDKDRTAVESSKLPLELRDWKMTGYRDARSFRFLGIPFADPPVDELRFQPPKPYSGSRDIDATVFSDSCMQTPSPFGTFHNEGVSEDCLYLNVYTPVLPAQGDICTRRRVVNVYLYGGAFVSGSGALVGYDGGNFASRSDTVTVTLNYRLGALGFLSTGNLTTGSYGIRDQIMALRWVKEHIFAFGGDPSKINIFGQSAGGQSVVALLSSSAASGLFSGAIAQSAPLDLPWSTREVYAELITPKVAKAVGCEDASDSDSEQSLLKCLRSVPATEYVSNSSDFQNALSAIAKDVSNDYLHVSKLLASIEPFMPVVDDTGSGVIDDQFHTLLSNNALPNKVPTMFTTVTDESSLYVYEKVPKLGSSDGLLETLWNISYPDDLAELLVERNAFPVNNSLPDATRKTAADALTYSEWTCPEAYLLNHGGNDAFPKLFEAQIGKGHIQTTIGTPEICSPNEKYNVSCHASDVLPVWGTLNSKNFGVDPYYSHTDLLHSQMMNDIFGAFFRTHDPNPDPEWLRVRGPAYAATYDVFGTQGYRIEQYTPGTKSLSLLTMPPSLTENPGLTEQCDVFADYGYTFQRAELTE